MPRPNAACGITRRRFFETRGGVLSLLVLPPGAAKGVVSRAEHAPAATTEEIVSALRTNPFDPLGMFFDAVGGVLAQRDAVPFEITTEVVFARRSLMNEDAGRVTAIPGLDSAQRIRRALLGEKAIRQVAADPAIRKYWINKTRFPGRRKGELASDEDAGLRGALRNLSFSSGQFSKFGGKQVVQALIPRVSRLLRQSYPQVELAIEILKSVQMGKLNTLMVRSDIAAQIGYYEEAGSLIAEIMDGSLATPLDEAVRAVDAMRESLEREGIPSYSWREALTVEYERYERHLRAEAVVVERLEKRTWSHEGTYDGPPWQGLPGVEEQHAEFRRMVKEAERLRSLSSIVEGLQEKK